MYSPACLKASLGGIASHPDPLQHRAMLSLHCLEILL